MKKKKSQTKAITNRRARFDYEIGDSLIVGLQLSGGETKSLRHGHGQLRGAYVTTKDGELWLVNSTISGTNGIPIEESEQRRTRKLLAKRREIEQLIEAKQQGKSIVPLDILTQGRYIKLRIAVGKGKKRYDKRQIIKKREADRKVNSLLKNY